MRPEFRGEWCNEAACERSTPRADGNRCGGVLFGVREESVGCGRFFCDKHLVGHAGPFYCGPCWGGRGERMPKKERARG